MANSMQFVRRQLKSRDTRNGATWWMIQTRRMINQSVRLQQSDKTDHNCSTTPARSLRQVSAYLSSEVWKLVVDRFISFIFYFLFFYVASYGFSFSVHWLYSLVFVHRAALIPRRGTPQCEGRGISFVKGFIIGYFVGYLCFWFLHIPSG
jgi:hypothetical protein